jgi:hypothetical protein
MPVPYNVQRAHFSKPVTPLKNVQTFTFDENLVK